MLTVKRPILVKVRVTEQFKNKMALEIQDALKKLDNELMQLDFQLKRAVAELEKKNPSGIPSATQQIKNEKEKRYNAKAKLTEQLKGIGNVPIGSEIVQGTLESYAQIEIGDDWNEIMGMEIVVCDDKIVDIRRSKNFRHDE